jgi:hypothetical protein
VSQDIGLTGADLEALLASFLLHLRTEQRAADEARRLHLGDI